MMISLSEGEKPDGKTHGKKSKALQFKVKNSFTETATFIDLAISKNNPPNLWPICIHNQYPSNTYELGLV